MKQYKCSECGFRFWVSFEQEREVPLYNDSIANDQQWGCPKCRGEVAHTGVFIASQTGFPVEY